MLLPTLTLLVAQAGAAVSTQTQTPQPLKEIIHVHSSMLCTALRNNLFPAVEGLRVNDELVGRGQKLLVRTASDAAAYAANASRTNSGGGDPFQQLSGADAGSESAIGGGSNASEMDAYQLGILEGNLAKSLGRVDELLQDPHVFPSAPKSDDERALVLAKSSIEAVIAQQRASLNILSGTEETNAVNDLKSRRDVIPYEHCMTCGQTPSFTPISAPNSLAAVRTQTQQTESGVAPAILPIATACR